MNGCGGVGGGTGTSRLNLYVPKPDEIVTDTATGETYVKGILLLYAKEGVSPEAIAELAKGIGGTVVGSIPQVRLYQIKIEGATAEVLRQLTESLTNHPLLEGAYLDIAGEMITPIEGEETPPPLEEERSRLAPSTGEWEWKEVNWDNNDDLHTGWWVFRKPLRNWYLKMIRAHIAWDITRGSRDHSKIAIIDSGFYVRHEDLKDNVAIVSQLTHPENVPGWSNHGTAVAGLTAAVGGNGKGVCGVCWFASLRLFGVGAVQSDEKISLRSLWIAGLVLAADSGARVVNMSFGVKYSEEWERFFRPAMLYAKSRDCLMVMSAGNDNQEAKNYLPKAFAANPELKDYVLVVGACNIQKERSTFSNYGDIVEIYAPGGDSKVGLFTISPLTSEGQIYNYVGAGTSFAAPLVTGTAGLLLAVNPNLSAPELKRLLLDGATLKGKIRILNAANSVRLAANQFNIPVPVLTANQTVFESAPAGVTFDVRGSVVPSFITQIVLDFGDGTQTTIKPTAVLQTTVQHSYSEPGVYKAELRFYSNGNTAPVAVDSLKINVGKSEVNVIIK
jgi:hypothetical protein